MLLLDFSCTIMDIRVTLKETRRHFTENDMMVLHMRKVKQLFQEQTGYAVLEQGLILRCKNWISRTDVHTHEWLKKEKFEIMDAKQHLVSLKSGEPLHSYLLDAAVFLNTHHTLSARMLANGNENTHKLATQIKNNTRQYVMKFFPSLVPAVRPLSVNPHQEHKCNDCGGVIIESENSHTVCQDCGTVEQEGFSRNAEQNLNYADMQDLTVIRHFTYRRLNHFR